MGQSGKEPEEQLIPLPFQGLPISKKLLCSACSKVITGLLGKARLWAVAGLLVWTCGMKCHYYFALSLSPEYTVAACHVISQQIKYKRQIGEPTCLSLTKILWNLQKFKTIPLTTCAFFCFWNYSYFLRRYIYFLCLHSFFICYYVDI